MRHAVALAAALFATTAAGAEVRWATASDPGTLDPHAQNTATVLGFPNNVYEGLVRRGRDMRIEPALAERWEALPEGRGWRFHLRPGVRFHDGAAFDADDVVFSHARATSAHSDVASWFAGVTAVAKADARTVDFLTATPNPIFPDSIANFMILDSGWADANGAGPFRVTLREPGLRTVLKPFAGWWGAVEHNLTRATHTPIRNPATMVSALLTAIQSALDDAARQAMLDETVAIMQAEAAYAPLYVQPLLWGTRAGVTLSQRADNFFILRWVTVN